MSYTVCCVHDCMSTNVGAMLHRFPDPRVEKERFDTWIKNIGGEVATLNHYFVLKNRRVCRRHFEEKYFCAFSLTLVRTAVPTLNLPDTPASVKQESTQDSCDVHNPSLNEDDPLAYAKQPGRILDTPAKLIPRGYMTKDSNACNLNVPSTTKTAILHGTDTSARLYATSMPQEFRVLNGTITNICNLNVPGTSKLALLPVTGKRNAPTVQELKALVKSLRGNATRNKLAKKLLKEKLSSLRKNAKDDAIAQITQNKSKAAKTFLEMQMKQTTKKSRGRRFTSKEKILALSLRGLNHKAYRSLSEICILPKQVTLQKFLQKVPLKPGINDCLFSDLKKKVTKMPKEHRLCSLIFDVMTLTPNINYDETNDEIIGFTNNGLDKSTNFCNQALVFMVRGIIKKYKQPIAYIFCNNIKSWELSEQIRIVISKLQETGLNVMATVCHHAATNMSAINMLLNATRDENDVNGLEWRGDYFEVYNKKIVPLYDPSHLLKGIRNNLINKDLQYIDKGNVLTAKWKHIIDLYELAPGYNGVRLLPKLTPHHVIPDIIPKMRFKFCAQVFSRSVGVTLGYLASNGILPEEATNTADILMLFDDIFDSVNGNSVRIEDGKIFRTIVTPASPHHKLWQDCLPVIRSMKFIDNYGSAATVPSLTGWVNTIEGFKTILLLLQKLGQNKIFLSNFNQEAIKSFFASIRSHAGNGVPYASTFQTAYKTLVVNNLSGNSVRGNNKKIEITNLMTSLEHYYKDKSENPENGTVKANFTIEEHLSILPIDINVLISSDRTLDIERAAYLAYCSGSILIKCRQIYKKCAICKSNLETIEEDYHGFINTSVYENKNWLCYPTKDAFNFFAQTENIVLIILKKYSNLNNIVEYIKSIYSLHIDTSFMTCNRHKLAITKFLLDNSAIFHVTTWCKNINNILIGKKNHIDADDCMQLSAYEYWQNNKTKKVNKRLRRVTVSPPR